MDLPGYFPIPESKEKEKTLPKTEKEIISYLILHLKESTLLNKEEINYLSPFFSSYLITYFCKTLAKKAINNYTITITFHTQNKNLISLLLPALQDSELQKIFYIKTDYYLTPEKQDLFIQLKIKNPYLFKTRIGVPTREILGFVNLLNELFEHKYKDIQNSYEEELINTLQKTITKEDLLYIIYKNLTSPFLSRYFLFLSDRVKQDSQLDTKIGAILLTLEAEGYIKTEYDKHTGKNKIFLTKKGVYLAEKTKRELDKNIEIFLDTLFE